MKIQKGFASIMQTVETRIKTNRQLYVFTDDGHHFQTAMPPMKFSGDIYPIIDRI